MEKCFLALFQAKIPKKSKQIQIPTMQTITSGNIFSTSMSSKHNDTTDTTPSKADIDENSHIVLNCAHTTTKGDEKMKKLLISILLIAVVATTTATVCFATNVESEIVALTKKNEKVTDALCIVYKKNCVLAIKTEKFVSKKEYDTFKTELEKEICEKYGLEHVVVTANPKAMHAINKISELSETEREEAIKKFVEFQLSPKPHRPHLPQIQPRKQSD